LFAPPHSLSQRTTSFIASCHQGIHEMPLSRLIALIINARSAAESLIRKDQIMRDKPNSRAVGAAALRRSRVGPQAYPFFTMVRSAPSPDGLAKMCSHTLGKRSCDVGGARRDRTDDLKLAKLALSQLSYGPNPFLTVARHKGLLRSVVSPRSSTDTAVVGLGRVELPTSRLSGVRSNHLSYRPESPLAATALFFLHIRVERETKTAISRKWLDVGTSALCLMRSELQQAGDNRSSLERR
jgi:hypothetical protein